MASGKQIATGIMAVIGGLAGIGAVVAAATGNWEMVRTFLEIATTAL